MDFEATREYVLRLWGAFNSLAGVAVIVSVMFAQAVKGWFRWKEREVPAGMVWLVSFVFTIVAFLFVCWWAGEDIHGKVVVWNAVIAGAAGPIIVWGLKKFLRVDLDEIMKFAKNGGNGAGPAMKIGGGKP